MNSILDSIAGKILLVFFPTIVAVCILSLLLYVILQEIKKVLLLWIRLKRKEKQKDIVKICKKILKTERSKRALTRAKSKEANARRKKWCEIRKAERPKEN